MQLIDIKYEYKFKLAKQLKYLSNEKSPFAATPPLEAQKILFSMAVTESIGFKKGQKNKGLKLDFIDIRRAYFHAPARRDIFIELPDEER